MPKCFKGFKKSLRHISLIPSYVLRKIPVTPIGDADGRWKFLGYHTYSALVLIRFYQFIDRCLLKTGAYFHDGICIVYSNFSQTFESYLSEYDQRKSYGL